MGTFHAIRFPNESDAYRKARDTLLKQETDLRSQIETVAETRRRLPTGGTLKEDYVFQEVEDGTRTTFGELFDDGKPTLLIYNFMYPPGGHPCPMCTSFLDGLNGNAPYIKNRISLAVLAKAPAPTLSAWARERRWHNLRLLSTGNTTFNTDYHAEDADGDQLPLLHVFVKHNDRIKHFWSSETFFVPFGDRHPRHADQLWPLWNALDLTPTGRGHDWWPSPDMR